MNEERLIAWVERARIAGAATARDDVAADAVLSGGGVAAAVDRYVAVVRRSDAVDDEEAEALRDGWARGYLVTCALMGHPVGEGA